MAKSVVYELPKDIQEKLIVRLGDNDTTKKFMRMVGHLLGELNHADAAPLPKMKKKDADYKQIDELYTKAIELYRAIKAMDDPAWQRLPEGLRQRSLVESNYLIDVVAAALDEQTHSLKRGESVAFSQADIARVKTIEFCFQRRLKKYKMTSAENSPFHDTVQIILGFEHSPKALIRKALHEAARKKSAREAIRQKALRVAARLK